MKNRLPKSEVIKSVNSHLLTLLPFQEEHETDELPATDLLRSERFDVMSKYICKIKSVECGGRVALEGLF